MVQFFSVKDDWTKETIRLEDKNNSGCGQSSCNSFLKGVDAPKSGLWLALSTLVNPECELRPLIELDARFDDNGRICLYAFAKYSEN